MRHRRIRSGEIWGKVLPDSDLAERVVGQIDVADARVLQQPLADHEAGSRIDRVTGEA